MGRLFFLLYFIFINNFSMFALFLIKKYAEYFFIVLLSIIGSFFSYEIYYVYSNKGKLFEKNYYESENKKYHSIINFYKTNKKQDSTTIIAYNPLIYYKKDQQLLPITHATNSNMILCNEAGYYSKWNSDKYGFNNDDTAWSSNKKNIILVGDSFVEGNCVNRIDNINSGLKKLNNKYNFINFGIGGSSLIHQFALLREFWPNDVDKIFLFYYEGNDLTEIKDEIKNPIFAKYFNNTKFSQDLRSNIKKSDEIYRKVFESHMENMSRNFDIKRDFEKSNNYKIIFIDIFKLKNSRNLIKFILNKNKKKDQIS